LFTILLHCVFTRGTKALAALVQLCSRPTNVCLFENFPSLLLGWPLTHVRGLFMNPLWKSGMVCVSVSVAGEHPHYPPLIWEKSWVFTHPHRIKFHDRSEWKCSMGLRLGKGIASRGERRDWGRFGALCNVVAVIDGLFAQGFAGAYGIWNRIWVDWVVYCPQSTRIGIDFWYNV
jgi:hypothetical protein